MAPAPVPTGGPPGGGAGKRLPLWAWLAAGAGGLIIGFLFLRQTPSTDNGEQTDAIGGGKPQEAAGAVVVEPLENDLLSALGLRPYTGAGTSGGGSVGGNGGGSGNGGGGGESSATQTAIISQFDVGSLAPAYTSHPLYSGFTGASTPQPSPTSTGTNIIPGAPVLAQ